MTNEKALELFFKSTAPQSALSESVRPPELHVGIQHAFPPLANELQGKFEDLAKRSAPGSATNLDLTYTWRR